MQYDVKEGAVDVDAAVIFNQAKFLKLIHEKLMRDRPFRPGLPAHLAIRPCHPHNSGVTTSSMPSAMRIGVEGMPTTNAPANRARPPVTTRNVKNRM